MQEYKLQRDWTLSLDALTFHKTKKEIEDKYKWTINIKKLYTITTIQNFWRVFNNIWPLDKLHVKMSYLLFEDDSLPSSTDTIVELNSDSDEDIANMWQTIVMKIIGETFAQPELINGVSITRYRTCYIIKIYTDPIYATELSKEVEELIK